MLVLGLNMYHADSSAAILKDGKVVFAVAEERLNRRKHYGGVPVLAIQACLDAVGAKLSDVEHVAIGRDNDSNLGAKMRYALSNPAKLPRLLKMRLERSGMGDLRTLLSKALGKDPAELRFTEHHVEHHLAHIASAYYCSGWEKAAGFSYDGSGDFVTTMLARCEGLDIQVLKRVFVPHSIGSFYTMVCDFIGYRKYGDEGKVMGLAPYGTDAFLKPLSEAVSMVGGDPRLNLDFFMPFGSNQGMRIENDGTVVLDRHYSPKMTELFGEPRDPKGPITQRDMDLAYAMQHRFEEVFFELLRDLHKQVPCEDLAMAGGCALNSVANGKLFGETPFRRTYIQPAAGDEGLAVGAALYAYHAVLRKPRAYVMKDAYLGPEYSEAQVKAALDAAGMKYQRLERKELVEKTADAVAAGQVVGWFQGRMEWGPRALGNRSILAHPGLPDMKDTLNARIKHREKFRPFAPAILVERQTEYFEYHHPSPFMLHVYKIKPDKRKALCAVNHIDDTGRLQSVARDENPLYYDLIEAFGRRTGTPVILNTSFNENEPIVCAPQEAIACFQRTRMDVLAIGPFLALKTENPA